ncbi:hypothetical protein BJ508DRAFT_337473 [Ascobolus immersus RN42]|uniref:Cyanovirin-N domain-containing protein n=1 Tax=Ascobolus immersus RN42 TaxID=1160509 RepID=A0A3N4IPT6_ASCIM|nr:hypothetical protein BJ508DRAFT_337473 [Ascobolus immersus RN42]
MKLTIFSSLPILFGASALLFETVQGQLLFGVTCRGHSLSSTEPFRNNVLNSECKRIDGSWVKTSLDLNRCLGNQDGELVAQKDGGFNPSCLSLTPPYLLKREPTVIRAACTKRNGNWISSQFWLTKTLNVLLLQ